MSCSSIVLNALEVDPGKQWKGSWRWYEQEVKFHPSSSECSRVLSTAIRLILHKSSIVDQMLDCCRPLDAISKVGITLSEFACLARCNGLRADIFSPSATKSKGSAGHTSSASLLDAQKDSEGNSSNEAEGLSHSPVPAKRRKLNADPDSSSPPHLATPLSNSSSPSEAADHIAALNIFRRDLARISKGGEGMMALSYSRKALGQTGDGHFSPVAGFSEVDDQVSSP